jgi:hypothetical protein
VPTVDVTLLNKSNNSPMGKAAISVIIATSFFMSLAATAALMCNVVLSREVAASRAGKSSHASRNDECLCGACKLHLGACEGCREKLGRVKR